MSQECICTFALYLKRWINMSQNFINSHLILLLLHNIQTESEHRTNGAGSLANVYFRLWWRKYKEVLCKSYSSFPTHENTEIYLHQSRVKGDKGRRGSKSGTRRKRYSVQLFPDLGQVITTTVYAWNSSRWVDSRPPFGFRGYAAQRCGRVPMQ